MLRLLGISGARTLIFVESLSSHTEDPITRGAVGSLRDRSLIPHAPIACQPSGMHRIWLAAIASSSRVIRLLIGHFGHPSKQALEEDIRPLAETELSAELLELAQSADIILHLLIQAIQSFHPSHDHSIIEARQKQGRLVLQTIRAGFVILPSHAMGAAIRGARRLAPCVLAATQDLGSSSGKASVKLLSGSQ